MAIVHLKNSAGVISEYTGTPPFTINGLPAGTYTFTEGLTERSVTVTASGGGTPTPTPPPTLGALTLSPNTATTGTAYSGTVSGKTASSTLALSGTGAAGLSVSGTTVSGTPTTAGTVNIVETLAGATGSPRTSSGVLTVAASGGGTPTPSPTYTDALAYADGTTLAANGWTAGSGVMTILDGRAYGSTIGNSTAPFTPTTPNYEVEVPFFIKSGFVGNSFVILHYQDESNYIFAGALQLGPGGSSSWRIGANVGGTAQNLREVLTGTIATGSTQLVRVRTTVSGTVTTISMFINGVTPTGLDPVTLDNATIAAAGKIGLRQSSAAATATTGVHFESITLSNVT